MPYGDKTGPNSQGSMSGRKLGFCVGNNHAGFEANNQIGERGRIGFRGRHNSEFGMGRGRANGRFGQRAGQGLGFGRRYSDDAHPLDFNSKVYLENKIKALKNELVNLEKNLSDIKSGE